MRFAAVLIGACLAIGWCGSCSSQTAKFDQDFNQLQPHMTADQVKTLLGPPDLREVKPKTPGDNSVFIETWHYSKDEPRVVSFDNGQVISFGRDTAAAAAGSSEAELPAKPPQDIGASCRKDSECQSGNCHFHVCSGKTNCQVKLGGLCATDSDCCEGKCDFGACRK